MDREEMASKCDEIIRQASSAVNKGTLLIGWYGWILKRENLFAECGYKSEDEYYKACGIARTTWYRATAIAKALSHLPKKEVLAMTIDNAEALARASDTERRSPVLITAAAKEPARKFDQMLRAENPDVCLGARRHRPIFLYLEMSKDDLETINETIDGYMRLYRLKDRGQALSGIARECAERLMDATAKSKMAQPANNGVLC